MCEKFIFSKIAGFQAYSLRLYLQMNSFTDIFQGFYLHFRNTVVSPPYSPYALTQAPSSNFEEPPHALNTCEKP